MPKIPKKKKKKKPLPQLTFAEHKNNWQSCEECQLCETRRRVVLLRGKVPCDLLFVGEAPGKGEDVLGKPFIGPAGKLLDQIIAKALDEYKLTTAFTNLIACIPKDIEAPTNKLQEPPDESIEICSDRLLECIDLTRPSAIVCVGRLSGKWMPWVLEGYYRKIPLCTITHPAAILRAPIDRKGLAIQRCMVDLNDFVEENLT